MRGRKPKPIQVREREGNAGKRKLPDPLKTAGLPQPPSHLPRAGVDLWRELVEALIRWDAIDRVDRAALTAVCVQWARAEQARLAIRTKGLFAIGASGQVIEHPAVGIERAAHQLLLRFMAEYGGTAVARARIANAVAGVDEGPVFPDIGESPRLRAVK